MLDRVLWMMILGLGVGLMGIITLALLPADTSLNTAPTVADCAPEGAFDYVLSAELSERVQLPEISDDALLWSLMPPDTIVMIEGQRMIETSIECERAMQTWIDDTPQATAEPCPDETIGDDTVGDEATRRSS